MVLKMQNKDSISVFWILVLFIWLASTIVDRIWWNCFSSIPSWDQADYLNSAIEHARALSLLDGFGISDFKSILDLSPKIPPLASIFNGAVISIFGDYPYKAAWSLSFWNGFLIFNIASWGLYLKGRRFGLICVFITAIAPFLFQLRTDYVLELPLMAATTFYLFHLGRWSSPELGGKWIQLLIVSIGSLSSLLIKQSSLLVILPSLFFVFFLSFKRDNRFRFQLLCLFTFNILGILPWFYHNWIMILSGTYRAVFESARIEGDPSIFDINGIFWYFPFLTIHFGFVVFFIGLSGLIFIFLSNLKSFKLPFDFTNLFNKINFKWTWLTFNIFTSWTLTTLIPNKDERYIASTIPMIILILSLGFYKWNDWLNSYLKLKLKLFLLIIPIGFSIVPLLNRFSMMIPYSKKYYPVNEIIKEVNLNLSKDKKDTIIVVPSTPQVNQHNISYFGRIQSGNILGRQLGQSLLHKKPVLEQANLIILAEGNQGSVSNNSIVLDSVVRKSGYFYKLREFPREEGGSYSLWKRKSTSPKPEEFHKRFISLANGMDKGAIGIKLIFDEIAIQHMIDGHFKYQIKVRTEALSKLVINPNDIEALWTLSLLEILANRPFAADTYLRKLEYLIPNNPWPSSYRSIVNLAMWNPWQASKIANEANVNHKDKLLKALGDAGAVLGGALWRLPSSFKSIPLAVENIDKVLNYNDDYIE